MKDDVLIRIEKEMLPGLVRMDISKMTVQVYKVVNSNVRKSQYQ